jgi:CheY-like chemotaxis protein
MEKHMSEHLPVVVVDDKHELLENVSRRLIFRGWDVTVYDDIDAAAGALLERTEPFVVVLDHDFDRPDGRTGLDLAELLRSAHPWGAALPICYYSGRIGGDDFLLALHDRQLVSPSSYTHKKSDVGVPELVEAAEQAFFRFRDLFEQQALRRALLNVDEDIVVDADELVEEES